MPEEPWRSTLWALSNVLQAYIWEPYTLMPPESDSPMAGIVHFQTEMHPVDRRRFVELAERTVRQFEDAGIPNRLLYVHLTQVLRYARWGAESMNLGGSVSLPWSPHGLDQLAALSAPTNPDPERKRKGGRPRVSPTEARKREALVEKWKQARDAATPQKTFCTDEHVTWKYLTYCINWATQRRRRKSQGR